MSEKASEQRIPRITGPVGIQLQLIQVQLQKWVLKSMHKCVTAHYWPNKHHVICLKPQLYSQKGQ